MSIARTNNSEQTRHQILAAALRLFATHGYAGTSTQAIITASRVSKPVLYYHFGSKAGLFRVIAEEAENQLLEVILKAKAGASDVRSELEEICAALFQFARENPSVIGLALELAAAGRGCPFRKQRLEKRRQRHAVIGKIMEHGMREGLFRKEFKQEELVVSFVGLLHSHLLHFLSNPHWPLSRSAADRVISSFLTGTTGKPKQNFNVQRQTRCQTAAQSDLSKGSLLCHVL
jgi:AcrR family transcriptional regulator